MHLFKGLAAGGEGQEVPVIKGWLMLRRVSGQLMDDIEYPEVWFFVGRTVVPVVAFSLWSLRAVVLSRQTVHGNILASLGLVG